LVKAVNVKKLFSSFILLSLILFLFSGSQFVNFVSANFSFPMMPTHSIEITEDGAVTGTDKIHRSGNIYTFTGDIMGSIVIFRSGIVVDGAGYTLQGNGSRTGFWLQEKHDVEIKNLHVRNFDSGMVFTWGYSSNGCKNITLSGNTIADNKYGIIFKVSGNNNVLGNTIANNTYGISITPSPNNTFRNNQLTNNKYSFWVRCTETVEMAYYINDIDESNTIDGKHIIYWVNEQDKTVPSDAGYVALVNCTNITVQNLVLANNSPGILLVATSDSHITKNHLTNNSYGIVLFTLGEQCIGNTITENTITANINSGIISWESENTIITGNSISSNQENGIYFYGCRGAVISGNTITANKQNGIYIWGDDASDNTISGNHIENNRNGISLEAARNTKIIGNSITSNSGWGIILNYLGYHSFSNNTIYRNNFANNQQALYIDDESFPSDNDEPAKDRWDNGTEGNYWSNYNGTDADGDGIGDTPYIINENNQDNHPLMEPTVIPEFPAWTHLVIMLVVILVIMVIYRHSLQKQNQRRKNQ